MKSRKHKPHGTQPFKPNPNDRYWALDVNAYERARNIGRIAISDVGREFSMKRKAEIRARWPNHSKVFDAMDEE